MGKDKEAVKNHVAKHYADFDKGDPPWKKEAGQLFARTQELIPAGKVDLRSLATYLIADLAEFFEPEKTAMLEELRKLIGPESEKLKEFMDRLIIDYCLVTTDELMGIKTQVNDLSARISALSEAERNDDGDDEPSELEIVDSEKDQEAVRAVIRGTVVEVLGELAQTEIDRMKGRVK